MVSHNHNLWVSTAWIWWRGRRCPLLATPESYPKHCWWYDLGVDSDGEARRKPGAKHESGKRFSIVRGSGATSLSPGPSQLGVGPHAGSLTPRSPVTSSIRLPSPFPSILVEFNQARRGREQPFVAFLRPGYGGFPNLSPRRLFPSSFLFTVLRLFQHSTVIPTRAAIYVVPSLVTCVVPNRYKFVQTRSNFRRCAAASSYTAAASSVSAIARQASCNASSTARRDRMSWATSGMCSLVSHVFPLFSLQVAEPKLALVPQASTLSPARCVRLHLRNVPNEPETRPTDCVLTFSGPAGS